jgi:Ni,Fe-hydrogenase III small subunit
MRHVVSSQDWLTRRDIASPARLSVYIREADAGSPGDCEAEIAMLPGPTYDLERFGFHIVASPKHADLLLITGPFTRSMASAVLAAFDAMPRRAAVVTAGRGFDEDACWAGSYATIPLPQPLVKARVGHIPGDPPSPEQLLAGLLAAAAEMAVREGRKPGVAGLLRSIWHSPPQDTSD